MAFWFRYCTAHRAVANRSLVTRGRICTTTQRILAGVCNRLSHQRLWFLHFHTQDISTRSPWTQRMSALEYLRISTVVVIFDDAFLLVHFKPNFVFRLSCERVADSTSVLQSIFYLAKTLQPHFKWLMKDSGFSTLTTGHEHTTSGIDNHLFPTLSIACLLAHAAVECFVITLPICSQYGLKPFWLCNYRGNSY